MVIKKDHGKKSQSTSLLYDLLNEAKLPDHLLSENSPIKKKRNAERFFDALRYAIFIESIYIQQSFIAFLNQLKEKLISSRATKVFDIKKFFDSLAESPKTITKISKSLDEQKQRLNVIVNKLDYLHTLVNTKLNKIADMIAQKKREVKTLEGQTKGLHQDLARKWKNHFKRIAADPDIELSMHLPLPKEFKHLPGATHYQDEIKINKDIFNQLADEAEAALLANESVHKLHPALKQKFEDAIKEDLHKALSFIPEEERIEFINRELHSKKIQALLQMHFWQDMHHDKNFMLQLKKTYEVESQISIKQAEIAVCENHQSQLQQMQRDIERVQAEQVVEANNLLAKQTELNEDVERKLNNLDEIVDHCFDQTNLMDSMLKQELDDIASLIHQKDELFGDLVALDAQGEDMLLTGISRVEEDSMTITLNSIHEETDALFEKPEFPISPAKIEDQEKASQDEVETPSTARLLNK